MNIKNTMRKMNTFHIMHTKNKKHAKEAKEISSYRMIPVALLSLLAVILSFSLTSCTEDADETDSLVDETQVTLRFTVNTRNGNEGETYGLEQGSIYENDISTYRIYFFGSNDQGMSSKYIATFTPTQFSPSDDKSIYTISGKIDESLIEKLKDTEANDGSCSFRILMLANWPHYPDEYVLNNISQLVGICNGDIGNPFYTCPTLEDYNPVPSIPFYGVRLYKGVEFTKGDITTLDEYSAKGKDEDGDNSIKLLRAMAKIEVVDVTRNNVVLDDETLEKYSPYYPEITEATICRYNGSTQATAYCPPLGVYDQSAYEYDEDIGYYTELYIHLDANDDANKVNEDNPSLPTLDMYQQDDYTWLAYIPEYRNTLTTGTYKYPCYIKIKIKCNNGDGTNGTYNYDKELVDYFSNDDYYSEYFSYSTNSSSGLYEDLTLKIPFAKLNENTGEMEEYDIHRNVLYRFDITFPLILDVAEAHNRGKSTSFWLLKKK